MLRFFSNNIIFKLSANFTNYISQVSSLLTRKLGQGDTMEAEIKVDHISCVVATSVMFYIALIRLLSL